MERFRSSTGPILPGVKSLIFVCFCPAASCPGSAEHDGRGVWWSVDERDYVAAVEAAVLVAEFRKVSAMNLHGARGEVGECP